MKKINALVMTVIMLISCIPQVNAADVPVEAPAAILMHPSGEVIFEKNADVPMAPASVTKIMTMLLVMEALENGSLTLQDTVVGSANAASMGGSQIWLKEGETFTVEEMLKCVAVASANDCSVALAEHLSGSEAAFVSLMNERALELGMSNTSFVNCCGLEAEGHLTTARDIALMTAELIKHESIFDYTTIWTDTVRNGAFGLTNTNKMIRSFKGMKGLKTGYTSEAGYCLSGVAERDGMTLIAVVLKGQSSKSRNSDVAALLEYGFANYAQIELTADQPLMPVPVRLGKADCVAVKLEKPALKLIEKTELAEVRKEVQLCEEAEAPVTEGDVLGSFRVYSGEEMLCDMEITAAESVSRLTVIDVWKMMFSKAAMRGK